MIRDGADRLQHDVLNNIEVSVYMQPPCGTPQAPANCLTPQDRTNINKTLLQLPQVKGETYISSRAAYERFKDYFTGDPDLIKQVGAEHVAAVVCRHPPRIRTSSR